MCRCVDCVLLLFILRVSFPFFFFFFAFSFSSDCLTSTSFSHRRCYRRRLLIFLFSFCHAIMDFAVSAVVSYSLFVGMLLLCAAPMYCKLHLNLSLIVSVYVNVYVCVPCTSCMCAKRCESIQVPKPKSQFNVIINEIAARSLQGMYLRFQPRQKQLSLVE